MRHSTWFSKMLGVALLALAAAGSAHAQSSRTWVSGTGNDANTCSRTAPCKTFAGAIGKTDASGEINCLDSGDFGPLNITMAISIVCDQGTAGVFAPSAGYAVFVNAGPNDRVLLQGLDIDGQGTVNYGIYIAGGGRTTIRKCAIRNFAGIGVTLNAPTNARVFIEETLIAGNASVGLAVQGPNTNNAVVDRSIFDSNGVFSIRLYSAGTIFVSGSMLSGATYAFYSDGGGSITSYGDNIVRGLGTPTTTLPKM